MRTAVRQMDLSARAYHPVLKLVHTLADLAEGFQSSDPISVTVSEDETTAVHPIVLQEESTDTALYLPAVSANSAAVTSAARVGQLRQLFLPAVVR